jgi:hypothetical protein
MAKRAGKKRYVTVNPAPDIYDRIARKYPKRKKNY